MRQAIYIVGKDRDTGADAAVGFWNELETATLTVINGKTGISEARDYQGAGSLITIGSIPLTNDLTIQTVRVTLSQVNEAVLLAIRGYEPRLASVDIHRVPFDLATRQVVGVPPSHFFGRVDTVSITTPSTGEEGSIELECKSFMRELTRVNGAKRSDESQKLRSGDRFRRYAGTAWQAQIDWGEAHK